MNIKELTYKVGYKKVFNEIYKIYLGDKDAAQTQEYDCKFYTAMSLQTTKTLKTPLFLL
jgi:hypothetical protein